MICNCTLPLHAHPPLGCSGIVLSEGIFGGTRWVFTYPCVLSFTVSRCRVGNYPLQNWPKEAYWHFFFFLGILDWETEPVVSGSAHGSTLETMQILAEIPRAAPLSTFPNTPRCPHIHLKSSFSYRLFLFSSTRKTWCNSRIRWNTDITQMILRKQRKIIPCLIQVSHFTQINSVILFSWRKVWLLSLRRKG